eukprot:scaffold871_cov130-Cylindrotheca_fusiformis.AAC.5
MAQALSVSIIDQNIEEVIKEYNQVQSGTKGFTLHRVQQDWTSFKFISSKDDDSHTQAVPPPPLYFGMQIHVDGDPVETDTQLVTFYIGYSTWDGRCLFVDQLPNKRDEKQQLLHLLAKIAVRLKCRRLIWLGIMDESKDTTNPPETLQDWLILRMDRQAMENYVGKAIGVAQGTSEEALSCNRSFVEKQVKDCLVAGKDASKFRLRLAQNTRKDAEDIARLVHGLAVYEKEPDAVQCTAEDYLIDGSGNEPLFYCLFIDYYHQGDDHETGSGATFTTSSTCCGMAVFYFGHYLGQGRFLYLEDLFLEEAFRKRGGGSLALKTLAEIGLRTNCDSFYWTALDWNTPALNLYAKIGAKVQQGLRISRYTDSKLVDFAHEGTTQPNL